MPFPSSSPTLERGRAPTFARWGEHVRLIRDPTEELYYIDCSPGYHQADQRAALEHARMWGLEEFDPNDPTTEYLPDDTMRIWLHEAAPPSGRSPRSATRIRICPSPVPPIRPATPRS